jgi:glycosyltransferase involved in cell wall biosynthesis
MITNHTPRVSICCLTYNHEAWIKKAIEGFLLQKTDFDVEIVIHDDASTDATPPIIEAYQHKHPEMIRPILNKENLYRSGTSLYEIYTRKVFPKLKGKYIAICEGDDYWTDPLKLQKQVDFLEQHSDYSISFHRVGFVGDGNVNFDEHSEMYKSLFSQRNSFTFDDLLKENFIPNCSVVYRNDAIDFPDLFHEVDFPDWPIHLIFAQKGKLHFMDELMAHHRISNAGMWEGKSLHERYRMNALFYQDLLRLVDETYYSAIFEAIENQKNYNTGLVYYDFFKLGQALALKKNEQKTTELQSTLDLIYNSKSWKIADNLRNFYYTLFPENSLLRKAIQQLLRGIAASVTWIWAVREESKKKAEMFVRLLHRKKVINQKWPDELPLVSVIIPNYNYGKYISETIQSVLEQTFLKYEIIIVDGGSTDYETLEILKKIRHPKIQVYFREGRHLVGSNRNFGINLAKGKYICCLDADDIILPTYLEKAVYYLEAFHYDVVYPWVKSFGESDVVWKTADASYEILTQTGNQVAVNAVFKKLAWQRVNGYKDYPVGSGYVCEDWEFWVRLAGFGFRFKSIPEVLMHYRVHNDSLLQVCETPLNEQKEIIRQENSNLNASYYQRIRQKSANLNFKVKHPFINLYQPKQRKRILVALPFMITGGVDTIFTSIFGYLSKKYDIAFFTTVPVTPDFGDTTNLYRQFTQEIYHLPLFLKTEKEKHDFILYLIAAKQADLMVMAGSEMTYHLLPRIRKLNPGLKIVDFIFNEEGHIKNNRKYAPYIDCNIVENVKLRDFMLHVHNEKPEKLQLIQNGVNYEKFALKRDTAAIRAQLGVEQNVFVVGFLGRFSEEKGPDAVVEIARLVKRKDVLFLMCGNGPLFEATKNLILINEVQDFVRTPGFVQSQDLLAVADVLLLPSRLDGRPNAVLEALASGVPVVASNVGGLPTLINHGDNGFLIPPDDYPAFAHQILELKNNKALHQRISASAQKYAREVLDQKFMHQQWEEMVEAQTAKQKK